MKRDAVRVAWKRDAVYCRCFVLCCEVFRFSVISDPEYKAGVDTRPCMVFRADGHTPDVLLVYARLLHTI